MDILITYDVKTPYVGDSKNKAVKDAMKKIGYFDSFTIDGEEYFLPNTSLWKKNITAASAKADLLRVAKENSATIERLFATQFVNFDYIKGEKF
ncbi:hypothetical protein [Pedobacter nyackensis]|uniref:hypothetical protein n=1 Tax=Pedobacter nyackensis TaxID=475255 RepID=UPI0029314B95|nr:hypothetical protein [Pedobacter nyackensis]